MAEVSEEELIKKLSQASEETSSGLGELDEITSMLDKIMQLLDHPLVQIILERFLKPRAPVRPVDPLQAVLSAPDDPEMFKRYINTVFSAGGGNTIVGGRGVGSATPLAPPAPPQGFEVAPLDEDIAPEKGDEAPPGAEPEHTSSSSAKAKLLRLVSQLSEKDAEEILKALEGEKGEEEGRREDSGE